MPNCPYCKEWLLTEDTLEAHIREKHSDLIPDAERLMSAYAGTLTKPIVSAILLGISLKYKAEPSEVIFQYLEMLGMLDHLGADVDDVLEDEGESEE